MEITLSILIPIYNFNCVELVEKLHHQALVNQIDFEIICIDDASTNDQIKTQNRKIEMLPNVILKELDLNIGRSRIRNKLAASSSKDYLLFLDCDSGIDQIEFIKNYIRSIIDHPNCVIYGGTRYEDYAPKGCELHWKYGKQVESPNYAMRNTKPYHFFKTNNFTTPKTLFHTIEFDETISLYGYEDNVFAVGLKTMKIEILHIDNSVIHYGLDKNDDFLKKIDLSLVSLKKLEIENKIDTKLIRTSKIFQKLGIKWVLTPFKSRINHSLKQYLLKNSENITIFQIWKLFSYIFIK